MANITPQRVTSLYRSLLRTSGRFANYNFREHSLRRTKDLFKANKGETDQEKIRGLVEKAEGELRVLQRQTVISQFYQIDKMVVEGGAEGRDTGKHGETVRVKDQGWN